MNKKQGDGGKDWFVGLDGCHGGTVMIWTIETTPAAAVITLFVSL